MKHTPVAQLVLPPFESKEFRLTPNNPICKVIDTTRLMVEVLWGMAPAGQEVKDSEFAHKVLIDGQYALVIRYKREKDGTYRPACVLSFDEDDQGNIMINQLQWSHDKHIGYRFHSSFNQVGYFLKLIEESFLKKWIFVEVKKYPNGIDGAVMKWGAYKNYEILQTALEWLNRKYGLQKK